LTEEIFLFMHAREFVFIWTKVHVWIRSHLCMLSLAPLSHSGNAISAGCCRFLLPPLI